jgi:predicted nucleotidyltransferase
MSAPLATDPILKRFRAGLDKLYGDRIERVVLFGSRARGDAHEDSDYDILLDTGAVISAKPFHAGAYQEHTGFMHELRQDGIDL